MIELKQVSYQYPMSDNGIKSIDISIETGQLLAVLGQSGSGKTTLLNLIAGFLQPSQGEVCLAGKCITHLPVAKRNLGIVFQHYALFPHMSVLDNIAYPLKLRGMKKAQRREKARDIASRVGLSAHIGQYPENISGGQQQRVALARALVFEPQALLLDEPLSALDAGLRSSMREEIREIQQHFAITTLLITHDQEEAMTMADQVAVLQSGQLLQMDSPKMLYHYPSSEAVAKFIGRANFLAAKIIDHQHIETAIGKLKVPQHTLTTGATVTAMIRPENILPYQQDENTFSTSYQSLNFLGASSQATLNINGQQLNMEGQLPDVIESISIPIKAIHLLADNQ